MSGQTMMVHHDNRRRPFESSSSSKYDGDGDVGVPAGTRFYSSGGAVNGGIGVGAVGGAALGTRPLAFEGAVSSSSPLEMMGYPFTQAQWRELERQAMIYKYMMASIPVPPDLLFPLPSVQDSHYYLGTGSYSLRCGKDPEPGRCRRTDGKKWRCSRDAAPDQKYCERHLNRGRPRSRKPVEVSASVSPNKKNRHFHSSSSSSNAPLPSTSAISFGGGAAESHHQHHTHHAAPMFVQGTDGFVPVVAASNKEGRGLDWLMIGDPHIAEEIHSHNSNYSSTTTTKPNQFNEYLFPLSNSDVFSMAEPQCSTPRGFIDAWSVSDSKQSSSISHNGQKMSLFEERGKVDMCLGVSHWGPQGGDARSWMSSALGGPLGEVLRPAISSPSSPNSGSPLISSPSGVLQRKMASVSDSSGGSSPITVQWFNPN
ncbi:hypothetical protein SAY87_011743 [Trapa incisa]|uniref:Growth-regulating factor n=1 Tax=Trapa incisa TaxID=236973 RepID=A0AAN7JBN6_9MYRT|nr:hypothetical protein SAY87_011743 [Trapa incisa]